METNLQKAIKNVADRLHITASDMKYVRTHGTDEYHICNRLGKYLSPYQKSALEAASGLLYPEEIMTRVMLAPTDAAVERVMVDARKASI